MPGLKKVCVCVCGPWGGGLWKSDLQVFCFSLKPQFWFLQLPFRWMMKWIKTWHLLWKSFLSWRQCLPEHFSRVFCQDNYYLKDASRNTNQIKLVSERWSELCLISTSLTKGPVWVTVTKPTLQIHVPFTTPPCPLYLPSQPPPRPPRYQTEASHQASPVAECRQWPQQLVS